MATSGFLYWQKYYGDKIGSLIENLTLRANSVIYEGWDLKDLSKKKKLSKEESVSMAVPKDFKISRTKQIIVPILLDGKQYLAKLNNIQKPITTFNKFRADIVKPTICNIWLSADEVKTNFMKHMKSDKNLNITKHDFAAFNKLISSKTHYERDEVSDKLLTPMILEIFQAIKIAKKIESRDTKILKLLSINPIKSANVWIYIPKNSNSPLIDFCLTVAGQRPNFNPMSPAGNPARVMRFSVKSQLNGHTNSIKLKDLFSNSLDAKEWIKEKEKSDNNVLVPGTILSLYADTRNIISAPIKAITILTEMLAGTHIQNAAKQLDFPTLEKNTTLYSVCKEICKRFDDHSLSTPLDTILSGNKLLLAERIIARQNHRRVNSSKTLETKQLILANFAVCMEKIIHTMAKKNGSINFYEVFKDQIMDKQNITYIIVTKTKNSIEFNYYTKKNFEDYFKNEKHLGLHSKNFILSNSKQTNLLSGLGIGF